MIVLSVPDMMCSKCVRRISTALNEAELDFSVSLEDKTVTIDGCEKCAAKAIAKLGEIGYDAAVKQ